MVNRQACYRRQMVRLLLISTAVLAAAYAQAGVQPGLDSAAAQGGATPQSSSDAPPKQPSAASSGELGEIVVTARKQNETVLDTPASVSVLTASDIKLNNVTNVNQLNGVVPGLVMTTGVAAEPGVTFRGLGTASASFGAESSVALFQDGVYLAHFRDYVTPFYDVAQVEMIRGTQSTLLGKNTSVGAISIVNNKPTDSFDYGVSTTHSFQINGDRVEGMINAPLGSNVQVRGTVFISNDDGYYRNPFTGQDEQQLRDISGRLSVAFQPTAHFDGLITYQHDDRHALGQNLGILSDPAGVLANRAAAAGEPGLNTAGAYVVGEASAPVGGTVLGLAPFDNQHTDRANAVLNFEVGPYTLTSQTAYLEWRAEYNDDLDFTAANLFNLHDIQNNRTVSEELRLASPQDTAFKYLVGGLYYDNSWALNRTYQGSPSNTVGFPLTGSTNGVADQPTRAASAFATARATLFDRLTLDAGLRYTHETRGGTFVRSGNGSLGASFPNIPFIDFGTQTENPLDYNFGVDYKMPGDVLLYVSYGKGTKSGGFQEFPTTSAGAPYLPETAYSTEAGLKTRLGNNGSLSAAIFNTRVDAFQTTYNAVVGTPPVAQTLIGNSNVRSRGFEASGVYRLWSSFTLSANVTYADARVVDQFPSSGAPVALAGERLVRAPLWSGKVAADYETELSASLSGFAGASLDLSSSYLQQFHTLRPDAPASDAFRVLNVQLGVRSTDRRWELALIGTNLTDDKYAIFATPVTAGGTGIGKQAFYGVLSRPLVVAMQLTFRH